MHIWEKHLPIYFCKYSARIMENIGGTDRADPNGSCRCFRLQPKGFEMLI